MSINLFGIADWLDDLRDKHPVLGEIVKQCIDQPLHVLMAVASMWAIGGATWGLDIVLGGSGEHRLLISSLVGGGLTASWMAIREYLQWPSSRWWDPPLDWLFEAGGLALGIWSFIAVLG